jgi:hypothetical protein
MPDGEQTAELLPAPADKPTTPASAEQVAQRPLGEILRADGGSILEPRDPAKQKAAVARTNVGIDLAASATPTFPGNDGSDLTATANSPQTAASAPAATRSADAAVAASATGGPRFEVLANNDVPAPPAEAPAAPLPGAGSGGGPSLGSDESPSRQQFTSAPARARAKIAVEDAGETEAAGATTSRMTQFTLIGIVGLLTGIAGMFGLAWWQKQERKHYAKAG